MRKSEKFLWAAVFLCIGMVLGFLIAPIKGGVSLGNYSGNTFGPLPEDEDGAED